MLHNKKINKLLCFDAPTTVCFFKKRYISTQQ